MGLLLIVLQVLLVPPAVFLAAQLSQQVTLVPASNPALSGQQIWHLIPVFVLFHASIYLIDWFLKPPFKGVSFARLIREICLATIASALSGVFYLSFSTIPFNASLLGYTYLIMALGHVALFAGIGRLRGFGSWHIAEAHTTLRGLITSSLAYATVLLALLPGVLAHLLTASPDFRGAVQSLKVAYNVASPSAWTVVDPFPNLVFEQPMDIRFLDEHEFYVLERIGRIKRVRHQERSQSTTVLDFSEVSTQIENGALSLALHPEFGEPASAKRGFIFVLYTAHVAGHQKNRLSRFDLSGPTHADRLASETILIEHDMQRPGLHNGGTLLFGPDGNLFLSLGDNKVAGMGQEVLDNFLGAVLRIDVDQRGGDQSRPITKRPSRARTDHYFIPKDNPFVDDDRVLDEYWALGLRNPFRMALDPLTGALWVGDVGEDLYDEIDRLAPGANAQWPYREGPHVGRMPPPDPLIGIETAPVYAYQLTALDRAVIGGPLYRGRKFPELYNKYIFADNQSGLLRVLDPDLDPPQPELLVSVPYHAQQGITSITTSPEGEIWVTVLGDKDTPASRMFRLQRIEETQLAEQAGGVNHLESHAEAIQPAATYQWFCARCHGDDGRGLAIQHQPDFTSASWQASVTDEHIEQVILQGGEALGMSEEMPAWEGLVTDEDVDRLIEKIRSLGNQRAARP